jgi:hypothetical protein
MADDDVDKTKLTGREKRATELLCKFFAAVKDWQDDEYKRAGEPTREHVLVHAGALVHLGEAARLLTDAPLETEREP